MRDALTRVAAAALRRATALRLATAATRALARSGPARRCALAAAGRSAPPRSTAPWSARVGGFPARGFAASASGGGDRGVSDASATTSEVASATDGDATVDATERDGAEKPNPRKDLYMMFTCGKCDTRAVKGFSRQAYDNGVVIVRCPGCQAQHLVADRYGWFGEPGSVEDFLRENGETVVRGREFAGEENEDGTLEFDEAQLSAWKEKVNARTPSE